MGYLHVFVSFFLREKKERENFKMHLLKNKTHLTNELKNIYFFNFHFLKTFLFKNFSFEINIKINIISEASFATWEYICIHITKTPFGNKWNMQMFSLLCNDLIDKAWRTLEKNNLSFLMNMMSRLWIECFPFAFNKLVKKQGMFSIHLKTISDRINRLTRNAKKRTLMNMPYLNWVLVTKCCMYT